MQYKSTSAPYHPHTMIQNYSILTHFNWTRLNKITIFFQIVYHHINDTIIFLSIHIFAHINCHITNANIRMKLKIIFTTIQYRNSYLKINFIVFHIRWHKPYPLTQRASIDIFDFCSANIVNVWCVRFSWFSLHVTFRNWRSVAVQKNFLDSSR